VIYKMKTYELASTTGKFIVEFSDKTVKIIGANNEVIEMDSREATKLRKIIAAEISFLTDKKGERKNHAELKRLVYNTLKEAERPLRWSEIRERANIKVKTIPHSCSLEEELNIIKIYGGDINTSMLKELKLPYKSCHSLWWLKEKEDEFRRKFSTIDKLCSSRTRMG